MRGPRRRHRLLIATATVAIGVPVSTAAWVAERTARLADHLTTAGGVPAQIGSIDADLTGTVRLSAIHFGSLVQAETIEASVAMGSLLAGRFGADEIRVAAPRIALQVDADGDSDLARLARRLGRAAGSPRVPSPKTTRVRRIVVDGGSLTARVAGVGDITADGVELVPDGDGVRIITGPVRVRGSAGPVRIALDFQRSAAELSLPRARFHRVLAVAGTGTLVTGDRQLALRDVSAGRLEADGALELRAAIVERNDGGVLGAPRPITAQLQLASSVAGAPGQRRDITLNVTGERVPLDAFASLVPRSLGLEGAHASGTLAVRRAGDSVEIELAGELAGARLDHRRVAPTAIPLAGMLRGAVAISPAAIIVRDAHLTIGAASLTAHGWLRRGIPVSGQLDLQLEAAPCPLLLAALPAELRGPLDGLALTGELGGRVHLGIDLAAPAGEGVDLVTALAGACEVADEPPAADVRTLAGIADQLYPDGTRARVGRGTPGWIEMKKIPWHVSSAFVSAEDGRYWDHHGFDLVQIARSLEIDLREHRLARGGSTISQQLIKNAFLTHRRSLDRKIQEAVLTWRLEDRLDKKQILERYLNIIELGPHVFGLGAAALHWFAVKPRELSVRQAAFLAALTSEPATMSRRVRHAGGLDPDSATRVDTILRAMRRDGVIDAAELDDARNAGMHFASSALGSER